MGYAGRGGRLAAVRPGGFLVARAAARGVGAAARGAQCLKASMIFAPACLVMLLAWSLRPSARRRRRPAVFLAPRLTASALGRDFHARAYGRLPFVSCSAGAGASAGTSAAGWAAGGSAGV